MLQTPFYEHRTELLDGFSTDQLQYPPHLHLSPELVYVERGKLNAQINLKEYHIHAGEFAVIFPNTIHAYHSLSPAESTKIDLLICGHGSECGFPERLISAAVRSPVFALPSLHPDVAYMFHSLLKELHNASDMQLIKAYFRILWTRLLPELEITAVPGGLTETNLVADLIIYISEHFYDPLSLAFLSKEFGVCKLYLSRIFNQVLHIGFHEYVNRLRVDHAKRLLSDSKNGILEIAMLCGFQSQQTFNRVFKGFCGMSPREYRKDLLNESIK